MVVKLQHEDIAYTARASLATAASDSSVSSSMAFGRMTFAIVVPSRLFEVKMPLGRVVAND